MSEVYINRIQKYLPNEPVSNEDMELYLGKINGNNSKSRSLILRNNRIKSRYYALDKEGNITHTNAQISALAIKKVLAPDLSMDNIELLTAGTTSPDALQPAHALMVHGELGSKPVEVMSAHGTCNSGMLSLKYAYLSIKADEVNNAITVASETMSSWMHARNFQEEIDKRLEIEENPYIAFEKDFLRWMLSDGAAAALLSNKTEANRLNLRIEWIDVKSWAGEIETCMYAGAIKEKDGKLTGWRAMTEERQVHESAFSMKQDAKLLQKHVIKTGITHLQQIMHDRKLDETTIDYFLPHLSSMFFRDQAVKGFAEAGIRIPEEKWFMNLPNVGNVGAASALLMLEEIVHSNKLKSGNRLLVMVPESARFSYTYMLLTVV
ncbi:MAG: beta-ketoacyl-ACP synthase III [Bacteroidales bacterium]|jgi:3-oxoacyl-[acyl-carrier-protein] synthase-3|nr:beta-ketoacyl-ACP synthase III [Bacteroidales bacterium]